MIGTRLPEATAGTGGAGRRSTSGIGTPKHIVGRERKRAIYPQEFLCLIDRSPDFEFLRWWNHWDLPQPL